MDGIQTVCTPEIVYQILLLQNGGDQQLAKRVIDGNGIINYNIQATAEYQFIEKETKSHISKCFKQH